MDASSAAAALAVAGQQQLATTIRELLLDRERLAMDRERIAMANEDVRSYMAQRHFTGSLQVPSTMHPMTWEAAYTQRHDDLLLAHDAMRAALLAQRQGDGERVEGVLVAELGSSSEEEAEEEEEEEEDAPTAA